MKFLYTFWVGLLIVIVIGLATENLSLKHQLKYQIPVIMSPMQLQQALNQKGYSLKVDGKIGQETQYQWKRYINDRWYSTTMERMSRK